MTVSRDEVFVARERELAQLQTRLEQTLRGEGQVAFVTGEAGVGKTALIHHFCRQAQAANEELVVAMGQCDAQTGAGMPYWPFVEILQLLTGDTLEGGPDDVLSDENASRLKSVMHMSQDLLLAFGPDLIDALVPGSGLVITAGTFIAEKTGLSNWVQQRLKGEPASATGITQENIFEQYSNVIRKLAESHPLILVLDDLQWADSATCQLLFRLVRRIEDRPVLVLGTYRPNDVAAGRDGERHPLEPVTAELTRYYGDIRIDLGRDVDATKTEAGVYGFVSAYVDAAYSPHSLGDDFVHLIANRTEGHPLFVVELLRDLEERGWLAQVATDTAPSGQTPSAEARWTLTQPVKFEALPPRVEGIIQGRIGRLDSESKEILTTAAVEGDEFVAQVIAQVQRLNERDVVRRLSRDLDRQHQLVAERGIRRIGRQRLYLFAFRHMLFQTHLYNDLGDIDRSLLHEDVGLALEELYGDQVTDIAVELAYHFQQAGLEERVLPYLIEAGDQARRSFANQEAVDYYSRALAIVKDLLATAIDEEVAGWQQTEFDVLGRREEMYDRLGQREEQMQDLEQMLTLAGELGEKQQAEAHNRQAHYFWATSDYDQAVEAASQALASTQAVEDQLGEGKARRYLGRVARETGDYKGAFEHFRIAADLFKAAGEVQPQANALIEIGTLHSELGQWNEALGYLEEGLEIAREIDSRGEQAWALDNMAIVRACVGDYSAALHSSQEGLALARKIGDSLRELYSLIILGLITAHLGDCERAMDLVEEALGISRTIQAQSGEAYALANLGAFHQMLERYDEALAHLSEALNLAQQHNNLFLVADCHYNLAKVYNRRRQSGDADQATYHASEAVSTADEAGISNYQILGRSSLALAYLAQSKVDEAVAASTRAIAQLEDIGTIEGAEEEVFFNHFQVLKAAGHPDAGQALRQAERIVRQKAELINDPDLRQSYLEQVPLNRRILRAAADQG